MLSSDWFIMMALGSFFILLGIGAIFWNRGEEQSYYDGLAARTDVREYFEHLPQRAGLGALKVGGWIFIGLGILLIVAGGALLLWG